MARLALHAFALTVFATLVGTARAADQPAEDIVEAASWVGVDATDLRGALNTTGMDALSYLYAVGHLVRTSPQTPPGWPIGGALGQRLYCIEGIESAHGKYMYNPIGWPPPTYHEHAQGWLGWLPSTAGRWGAVIARLSGPPRVA